jgi:hypothetical protein
MSIRTYNPSVRVGNWNEDLCLEEDLLKDFLERKKEGKLLSTQTNELMNFMSTPVELSKKQDDNIHFGDTVNIYQAIPQADKEAESCFLLSWYLENGKTTVTASSHLNTNKRNAFKIVSVDESKSEGDILCYDDKFFLYSEHVGECIAIDKGEGQVKDDQKIYQLESERPTFTQSVQNKSGKQGVSLQKKNVKEYRSNWQIFCYDPQFRVETSGTPVKVYDKILINHCKTNERLRVMHDYKTRTKFGHEYEVVAHTHLNSHKAEGMDNHFRLILV